jgi:hypothetical protein
LNRVGETIDSMERQYTQAELEDALKNWLKDMIGRIETERAGKARAIRQSQPTRVPPANQ